MRKDFEIRKFKFSHVFNDQDDQDTVFESTAVPIVESVMNGYNGCIMAYGQTGTGKTHTILGRRDGLLPKSLEHIFKKSSEFPSNYVVDISCLQIYMENLTDLFDYKKKTIQIREKNGSFFVTNSVWVRLNNFDEALQVIDEAEVRRKSCSTNMNQYSSRSHAIFIIKVTNIRHMTSSNLYLVDLAGSERIKKSYAQGDRLEEAISINTSLMALSKCIYGISENKWNHIPYRESKLTKILQETLAGNGRSVIVITVSPDSCDVDETISSLKFGQRASKIYCSPKLCKIDDNDLGNNVFAIDDHKKFLEEENLALREQCKQLMKIVETTTEKKKREGDLEELLEEDETENVLQVKPKTLNSPCKFSYEDMRTEYTEENYNKLLEENRILKKKIEEVELDAFDSMRLAYEDIEESLYSEISKLKINNKRQKKTIAYHIKLIAQLSEQLETAKASMGESKGSLNAQDKNEPLEIKDKIMVKNSRDGLTEWYSDLSRDKRSFLDKIHSIFRTGSTSEGPSISQIKSDLKSLLKNQPLSSLNTKENCPEKGQFKGSPAKSQFELVQVTNLSEDRILTSVDNKQNLTISDSSRIAGVNLTKSKDQPEDMYRSATPEDKASAQTAILQALDSLLCEVDAKCSTLASSSRTEEEALSIVQTRMDQLLKGFTAGPVFTRLINDFSANRFSIMKLAVGIIVDNLMKKLVLWRYSEKQRQALTKENHLLKSILMDEKVKELCVNALGMKNRSHRAAILIQRAFKKYRWRKNYFKHQSGADSFDWGRIKAAMGKENLQLLLTDIESSIGSLRMFLM